jgi:modulator of FtsH protease HflK
VPPAAVAIFNLPGGDFSSRDLGMIAGILLVVWLATGIYIIEPAERGVVTRFGSYVDTTEPGRIGMSLGRSSRS